MDSNHRMTVLQTNLCHAEVPGPSRLPSQRICDLQARLQELGDPWCYLVPLLEVWPRLSARERAAILQFAASATDNSDLPELGSA